MTDKELWKEYSQKENINHNDYDVWEFGFDSDLLVELVIKGDKTATSSLHLFYEMENEPLPKVEKHSVILNSKCDAVCIIKTVKVEVVPFNKVSSEFAFKEGEGDKSLEYWRQGHTEFFTKELLEYDIDFKQDMDVVCEEFELVYK